MTKEDFPQNSDTDHFSLPYFHINCIFLIGFQELSSISSSLIHHIFSKENGPSLFIYLPKKDHIMEENVSGIMGSSTLSFLFEDASLSKIF